MEGYIVTVGVAVVSGLFGYLTTRSSTRADFEKEAYKRALEMDTETIDRLKRDNKELRESLNLVIEKLEEAQRKIDELTARLRLVEVETDHLSKEYPQ